MAGVSGLADESGDSGIITQEPAGGEILGAAQKLGRGRRIAFDQCEVDNMLLWAK